MSDEEFRCQFAHSERVMKDLAKYFKKYSRSKAKDNLERTINDAERLLDHHFDSSTFRLPVSACNHSFNHGTFEIYYFRLSPVGTNLSKTQRPKVYFYRSGSQVGFLCFGTHVDNYSDSELRKIATERLNEML